MYRNEEYVDNKFIGVTYHFLQKDKGLVKERSIHHYPQLNFTKNYIFNEFNLIHQKIVLKNKVEKFSQLIAEIKSKKIDDTTSFKQRFYFIEGKIEKNQFGGNYNFLTINLGKNDSISNEMAVINSKGILGITEHVSNNYSRVQSILNRNSKINARLKNSSYFGSLMWNGVDYNILQLLDIPRQAIIKSGDTIVTGGMSTIFPAGIPIGKVIDTEEGSSIKRIVNIQLFNDMSNLKNIYVIKDFDKHEIMNLENNRNE